MKLVHGFIESSLRLELTICLIDLVHITESLNGAIIDMAWKEENIVEVKTCGKDQIGPTPNRVFLR